MSTAYQFCFGRKRKNYKMLFWGNSYVAGSGSTGGQTYPQQTIDLLTGAGKIVTALVKGIPGHTIDQLRADAESDIYIHKDEYDIICITEIINQWGLNPSQTKEEVYANFKSLCLETKAAGFKRVTCNTPIDQNHYARTGWPDARSYFISMMLSELPALGIYVANVGGDVRLSDWSNTAYYDPDEIHNTNLGYRAWAEINFNLLQNI